MKNQKLCAAVLAAVTGLSLAAYSPNCEAVSRAEIAQISVNKKGSNFQYWNKDAASFRALVDYVKDVTDPKSENFIPIEDRIAVFDMDGTFFSETRPYAFEGMMLIKRTLHDANYKPSESDREFALGLERFVRSHDPNDKKGSASPHLASVFAELTEAEYAAYVRDFMETPAEGAYRMKWGEAFYLPMVETIRYLESNQFQIFVVSGSERQLIRLLVCDPLHIPERNIIATDMLVKAAHQGDTKESRYDYRPDDYLVRGGFVAKNIKMYKVAAIYREIGKQPVLAFGNSDGDTSMLNYTLYGNKHKSAAFLLLCDDLERDAGDAEKAAADLKFAEKNGWVPISMHDDFKTIYGENNTKN